MAYSSTVAQFILDIFLAAEASPVALVKKHPDGFLWHTADKWQLGPSEKMKRHRSPVFGSAREAVANCLVWLEKNGVKVIEPRVEEHDVKFEPGRTRTAGSLSDELLTTADRLLAKLPPELIGVKKQSPKSQDNSSATGSAQRANRIGAPARVEAKRASTHQLQKPSAKASYTPMTSHARAAR